jgi:hypothetical protein
MPKPRIWSWEGIALAIVFGLGVLAWPMLSFGAIFLFDSPIKNHADELQRYTLAGVTWFYPALYAAAWIAYRMTRRRNVPRLLCDLAWCIPGITPACYLWFF